ncbi:hypothetical protein [Streptomyces sp. DT203]|uniref:hypothetical protein n=1 Tax=Streptomyces sp. DT203 TaxID=3393424 RepID=UPI003CEC697E
MSHTGSDEEVIDAELLDDGGPAGLPAVRETLPAPRYEVSAHQHRAGRGSARGW